jgi:uncharacterized repeat protein (TIGR01451 family)
VWRFSSLAPFQNLDVSFKATIVEPLPVGVSELTNFLLLTADCDTDSANDTRSHRILIGENYDLRLSKEASKNTVHVNEEFDYTLALENLGPGDAFDITVRDTLPNGIQSLNVDSLRNNVAVWHLSSLFAGADTTIRYSAKVVGRLSSSPLTLINSAAVSAPQDTNASNNFASAAIVAVDTTTPPQQNTDLRLAKAASADTVFVNEQFSYQLIIENLGPATAFEIVVRDTIPDLLTPSGFDSSSGNVLFWKFDSLAFSPNPSERTIKIDYQARVVDSLAVSPVTLINSSRVSAGNDSNMANNFTRRAVVAIDTTAPPPPPRPNTDLQLAKSASKDTVVAGEEFSYQLIVENLGPATAFDIVVRDTIPDLLTPSGFDSSSGNVLFWRFDSLAFSPNPSERTINIDYQARVADSLAVSPITLTNSSRVSADNDTNAVNNLARAAVVATAEPGTPCTDLAISKSASTDSARIGEPFFYTLTVSNLGPNPAFNITVRDSISEFITPDPNVSREGDVLIWRIVSLPVNQTATITFSAQINAAPAGNVPIPNTARVIYGCNTNTSNNVSPPVFVTPVPDFIRGGCEFFRLDLNVFEPEKGAPLGIHFEFNTSRVIRLDVYDISGYHIRKLVDETFAPGPHRFDWDGQSTNGQKIGAGVYVITLRSSDLICWRKVIVAR